MSGRDVRQTAGDQKMRRLFELSRRFRKMAPWDRVTSRPLFGIRHSELPDPMYVCVMGYDSHRPGLSAYLGSRGYHCCRRERTDCEDPLELINRAYHLKMVYMDRDQLRKEERQLIHRLDLKFRNRFNWPAFRSVVPGYVTWHLTAREMDWFELILEQTCQWLIRASQCADGLLPASQIPMRVADPDWRTVTETVPEEPEWTVITDHDPDELRKYRCLMVSDNVFSVDLFVTPDMLYDRSGRPYYPMCLVMSDDETGLPVHSALLGGSPDMDRFASRITDAFLDGLKKCGMRPETLIVPSLTLSHILEPLTRQIGIKQLRKADSKRRRRHPWPLLQKYESPWQIH